MKLILKSGTVYSLTFNKYVGRKCGIYYLGITHKGKTILIHRLIWMVANRCDIPEGYDIHHIDGNPLNNSIYNLELIESSKHNSQHKKGNKNTLGMSKPSTWKKIAQYGLDGELIKVWNSIKEAAQTLGIKEGNICRCCKSYEKTYKGFIWKYT